MSEIINAVFDFNERVIGNPVQLPLQSLTVERREWFLKAINEEATEFREAHDADDLIGQVDAICDMMYFAIGRLKELGLTREQAHACFMAIHNCNMTKKRGAQAKRGNHADDAVKPTDWVPPEEAIGVILFSEWRNG